MSQLRNIVTWKVFLRNSIDNYSTKILSKKTNTSKHRITCITFSSNVEFSMLILRKSFKPINKKSICIFSCKVRKPRSRIHISMSKPQFIYQKPLLLKQTKQAWTMKSKPCISKYTPLTSHKRHYNITHYLFSGHQMYTDLLSYWNMRNQHQQENQGTVHLPLQYAKINRHKDIIYKNFVPHCPEALRYAKVWGRDIVCNLTLAYAKRLFPDSNPWPTSHQGTTLPLYQGSPSIKI